MAELNLRGEKKKFQRVLEMLSIKKKKKKVVNPFYVPPSRVKYTCLYSCPLTSEENMVAQVPMHQHTTGFVILPCLMASQILYSSVPPICRRQRQMERAANR